MAPSRTTGPRALLAALGLLSCCSLCSCEASRTSGSTPAGNRQEQDPSLPERVKRGWVWNQFFVVEEYTGTEPLYVGKIHTDSDDGDGNIKYTISGEGAGTIFIIDELTGDIHATERLDREEKAFYTLRAQARDELSSDPLEPESEFVIKVQDINDSEPKFTEGPYIGSVAELSPIASSKPRASVPTVPSGTEAKRLCMCGSSDSRASLLEMWLGGRALGGRVTAGVKRFLSVNPVIDVVPLERTSGPPSGRDVARHNVRAAESKPQVAVTEKSQSPREQRSGRLIMEIKPTTILSFYPLMTQADVV
ncbi:unnamed protein product [Pleuronectes platessa]|uniref:Cadherin domain-containing protein n=1 Tax=Pleuronectes platessa TaxID=8262 RepID=A0A9N7TVG7_PLEPL|nr:unnamed protein product [Pleuronectes platessa]